MRLQHVDCWPESEDESQAWNSALTFLPVRTTSCVWGCGSKQKEEEIHRLLRVQGRNVAKCCKMWSWKHLEASWRMSRRIELNWNSAQSTFSTTFGVPQLLILRSLRILCQQDQLSSLMDIVDLTEPHFIRAGLKLASNLHFWVFFFYRLDLKF